MVYDCQTVLLDFVSTLRPACAALHSAEPLYRRRVRELPMICHTGYQCTTVAKAISIATLVQTSYSPHYILFTARYLHTYSADR